MSATDTTETCVASFVGFHTQNNLEDGSYYADKLVFLNCLHIAVIVIANYGQRAGDQLCRISSGVAQNEIHLHTGLLSRLTDCRLAAELRREDSLVILPAFEYYPRDLNNAATSRILVNPAVIFFNKQMQICISIYFELI